QAGRRQARASARCDDQSRIFFANKLRSRHPKRMLRVLHQITAPGFAYLVVPQRNEFTIHPHRNLLAEEFSRAFVAFACGSLLRLAKSNRPLGVAMSVALRTSIGILLTCALMLGVRPAVADEGGVSFWVPGFFGSLAATPQQPGWSFTTIFYHTSVSADADVAFARQVHPGNIQVNFRGGLDINLKAPPDLQFFIPSYTFATPVL